MFHPGLFRCEAILQAVTGRGKERAPRFVWELRGDCADSELPAHRGDFSGEPNAGQSVPGFVLGPIRLGRFLQRHAHRLAIQHPNVKLAGPHLRGRCD